MSPIKNRPEPTRLSAGYLKTEFPELPESVATHDRRRFLRLLGASMALAGITSTGCRRWPVEEIRPHTARPAGSSPGVAEHYATLFELDGVATGILAKSYDGRPIKIEGNPEHPTSNGSASGLAQASVLDLYDPDRSRVILQRTETPADDSGFTEDGSSVVQTSAATSGDARPIMDPRGDAMRVKRSGDQFDAYARGLFADHRAREGDGLAILLQPSSSPTQRRLVEELKQAMPKARWFAYQPLHRDHAWAGSRAAFGQPLRCQYDLTQAKTIVCFDADLLGSHPAHLKLARDWSVGRRSADQGSMNRLVSIEACWSVTGSVADTRIPLRPSQIELAVEWLAVRLGVAPELPFGIDEGISERLEAVAQDLLGSGGAAVVAAGPALSPRAHQWVHAINARLGNVGTCIRYTKEPLADDAPDGYVASIRELSDLLQGNVIQTLVIVGGNPVYDGPADTPLDLSSTLERPLISIHLSSHDNETSQACTWHLPAAHALETWSDGLAWDGTHTLGQPLILPLFGGKSSLELLSLLAGKPTDDTRSLIRDTFGKRFPDAGAKGWEVAIHDGFHADSRFAIESVADPQSPESRAAKSDTGKAGDGNNAFELQFIADAKTHDGRFANNAWLQELPEPLSKLTWDNVAYLSKADADRLHLTNGDVIQLGNSRVPEATLKIPVFVMPGQAVGCLTVAIGYGRTRAGRIGNGVGTSVYPLRTSGTGYVLENCTAGKTGQQHELATTQLHHVVSSVADFALEKRLGDKGKAGLLLHEATLPEYVHDPHAVHGDAHAVHAAPLYDQPHPFDTPHRWAMAIDLNTCIGCSGCVVACQAENNIPVVGKENVIVNREMHWLRIDRYFKGDTADPDMVHVPTACAHCETAPCEQVCPVAATVHDTEGLNAMVYNRCIGTRYCANNCPYKARRFNYFDYQSTDPREPAKPWLGIPDQQQGEEVSTLKKMVHNPEVTVRMRGVMEKCTYCVQRIADARITAKNEFSQGMRDSDLVREGEMQTACQATCPTQAIVFGDLNDPHSAVSVARRNARSYEMLAELNLGARTTYLAKIRNRDS
ncbi:MAG: 4Fe-4S dicluster domain-containing protein [Candidatus Paceibacterota bacterium]